MHYSACSGVVTNTQGTIKVIIIRAHAIWIGICYAGNACMDLEYLRVRQVAYLKMMGIVPWQKREVALELPHYQAFADGVEWGLLATAPASDAHVQRLLTSIAQVLGLTSVQWHPNLTLSTVATAPVRYLLCLGADLDSHIDVDDDDLWYSKRCIIGPSIQALIQEPMQKAALWAQLRPILCGESV